MTLYLSAENRFIIKFMTMSRQRYLKINNEIKRLLMLLHDSLFL